MFAQSVAGYQPLNGAQFEELLNKWLPDHDLVANQARSALTLRVLPTFTAESQLDLVCNFDSKCMITRRTLSKPLRRMANEALSKGASLDEVRNQKIDLRTDVVNVEKKVADAVVAGFWRSVGVIAQMGKRPTGKEVEVLLDATTYQIFQTEEDRYLEVIVRGPDASHPGKQKIDPVVKWSQAFVRQFEDSLKATKHE